MKNLDNIFRNMFGGGQGDEVTINQTKMTDNETNDNTVVDKAQDTHILPVLVDEEQTAAAAAEPQTLSVHRSSFRRRGKKDRAAPVESSTTTPTTTTTTRIATAADAVRNKTTNKDDFVIQFKTNGLDDDNDESAWRWWNRRSSHDNNASTNNSDISSLSNNSSETAETRSAPPPSPNSSHSDSETQNTTNDNNNDDNDDGISHPTIDVDDDDTMPTLDIDEMEAYLDASLLPKDKTDLKDKNFLQRLIQSTIRRARKVGDKVLLLGDMLELHVKGVYKLKSWEVGIIVACFIYILNPLDMILDALPCGLADDIAVVAIAVSRLSITIKLFNIWKQNNPTEFERGKQMPWFDTNKNRNTNSGNWRNAAAGNDTDTEEDEDEDQNTDPEENFENRWNVNFD